MEQNTFSEQKSNHVFFQDSEMQATETDSGWYKQKRNILQQYHLACKISEAPWGLCIQNSIPSHTGELAW